MTDTMVTKAWAAYAEHINITGEPSMRAALEAAINHALNNQTEGTNK